MPSRFSPDDAMRALSLVVIALFLASWMARARQRVWLRRTAIAVYAAAVGLALAAVAVWLRG
jgi:hypothetical protein